MSFEERIKKLNELIKNAKKIVLINRDETFLDDQYELVFHENLGEVFSRIKF